MIKLTSRAVLAIRKDTKLKGELQAALGISSNTLYKWLKENDQKLTTASALEAIRNSTELTDDELLTVA
jgi:DNA-binding transcriptional regulator YiaG